MKKFPFRLGFAFLLILVSLSAWSQGFKKDTAADTILPDSIQTYYLKEVDILNFKTDDEWREYYQTLSRVKKVIPYVKIANQLYAELKRKEESARRREYRRYRKDLEKEMRQKFENELKNLTINQGKVLVKLINRETGNNCYKIIKDVKGGFSAMMWQMVAKRYDYDLKENYDPQKESMIELVIKQLGNEYDVAVD
ncbi:MAG: DUF4294 domain-containing protein [Chitinophagales bacterium]|nr:DUF4294 domain-containing protein [Chitinophagales bacterium]MDW8273699.1 DUF4294 domain-containing protein [Chitinophagales bacterium]